jgi:predicted transcriptional regulator
MNDRTVAAADIFNGTVNVVSAYLSHNVLPHEQVADFIRTVSTELVGSINGAMATLGGKSALAAPAQVATLAAPPLAIAAPEAAPKAPKTRARASRAAAQPSVAEMPAPAETATETVAMSQTTETQQTAETAPVADVPVASEPTVGKFDHLSKEPVMPISQSVTHDLVYCLFDGVGKKMLKRWIRAHYDMEEDEYRAHFGLPAEYPLTAPGYSGEKSVYAKIQGLGTDKISKTPKVAEKSDNVRELARAA